MAKHNTYFISEDARAQAEFYAGALGGEIQSVMTYGQMPEAKEEMKDKVIHLSLVAAGVTFYFSDSVFGPLSHGNAINQCLEFESEGEAHAAFGKLSEGGQVQQPLEPAFWGALFGQLQDKFGVQWMVTTASQAGPA
ncbi:MULTISPECIES: VOC family protein [Paenibacillus]|uniref:VOC family protein n=1 Tax=Paenibacillus TaxID=44249 RepID=UPI0022B910B7|nr:VOC family protein [Paenibacillus caseinilyticus]MCZ8518539.1 VOC family protein [Paenibacillus caseinilyticus]